ncbi:MAG: hypothetical protein BGO60_13900 [Thiobacillus sp. 65-1059]|nr:MAG: hypothetical protein BGO60_13900 [Thiobacillus sp. 65-1059]
MRTAQMQLHIGCSVVEFPRTIEIELGHALRQHALASRDTDQVIEWREGDALIGQRHTMRCLLQILVEIVKRCGTRLARR